MKKEAILIFDIGKTNKKVLLFDKDFDILAEDEKRFEEIRDDDGFPCDDIDRIENWINENTRKYTNDTAYDIKAINFATYGATLMHVDRNGHRVTPLYNYLKPMPHDIIESLCNRYGGIAEFGRKTGSEVLGMLNSGLQIYWLKQCKRDIFERINHTLHFAQYLSYKLTGEITSEYTSLGCHTGLWDFDEMKYHDWVNAEEINLPEPVSVKTVFPAKIDPEINVGIGIHDSSASLVPFLENSTGKFILISTGTWCVSMNPFNHSPLTAEELEKGCLCYMSIREKPVKSSRFFLGHIHDANTGRLIKHFKVNIDEYRKINPSETIIRKIHEKRMGKRVFFRNGIPEEYTDENVSLSLFDDFTEAYHQLIIDLVNLTVHSIELITQGHDEIRCVYITGGFARNSIFTNELATACSNMRVYTSDVSNATSLGAALVLKDLFTGSSGADFDLKLKEIKPFLS